MEGNNCIGNGGAEANHESSDNLSGIMDKVNSVNGDKKGTTSPKSTSNPKHARFSVNNVGREDEKGT